MEQLKQYKCPVCGGEVAFDSSIQKMKCPYCDTEFEVDYFEKPDEFGEGSEQGETAAETEQDGPVSPTSQWSQEEAASMRVYACTACGGEIVTDETTAATDCPFCGNHVVMKEQLSGDLKPDFVIPFRKSKNEAINTYRKYIKKKDFVPRIFKDSGHIDTMKAVYVPFWLFDMEADADMILSARTTRVWIQGDEEFTEVKEYDVRRQGQMHFERVPADGSTSMDDALMESLEPYHYEEMVPFSAGYLAGYLADRYDVSAEECIDRVKARVRKSTERQIISSVQGYDFVKPVESNIDVTATGISYALCPVWLLTTRWGKENYLFAMNGQTGAMIGDLPFDKKAFWKYVLIRGLITAVVIYLIMWIIVLM